MRRRDTAIRLLEARTSPEGWVGVNDAMELLERYGLSPLGAVASGADAVGELAESIGFPVASKSPTGTSSTAPSADSSASGWTRSTTYVQRSRHLPERWDVPTCRCSSSPSWPAQSSLSA